MLLLNKFKPTDNREKQYSLFSFMQAGADLGSA